MAFIVAIAGGSCAGKTTIARALVHELNDRVVAIIAEDDYYICRTSIPGFHERTHNFDAPSAKDHALLAEHLAVARRGAPFEKPLYNFKRHERREEGETIPRADILVIEGLHAFTDEALRQTIDYKIFVEADDALRRERRLARDIAQRGRTLDSVAAQYDATVAPGHARWVAPQKAHADLVLLCTGEEGGAEAHARTIAQAILRRMA